jgi:hypothetical protein
MAMDATKSLDGYGLSPERMDFFVQPLFNLSTFQQISRDFKRFQQCHGTLNTPSFLKPSSKISEYSMTLLPQLFAHASIQNSNHIHNDITLALDNPNHHMNLSQFVSELETPQIPMVSYPQCLTQYSIIHQNSIPVVSKLETPKVPMMFIIMFFLLKKSIPNCRWCGETIPHFIGLQDAMASCHLKTFSSARALLVHNALESR